MIYDDFSVVCDTFDPFIFFFLPAILSNKNFILASKTFQPALFVAGFHYIEQHPVNS